MCGIFGVLLSNENNKEINTENINNYFMIGQKRGPEFSHFSTINNLIVLGFHRLAINGLDNESNQPLYLNDYVLVCNGEIYNHKELCVLYNFKPKTNNDCEVILHLYNLMSTKAFDMLDGVFSIILIDKKNNEVIIARDPYGVRPSYLCFYNNGNIGIASDMKQLLFDKNIESINAFEPGSYSVFKKIELDGSEFYIDNKHEKFFNINHITIPKYATIKPIQYYMLQFLNVFKNGIKKRVENCERGIVSLLSGGLDSSIVCAYINKYHKEKFGIGIHTYSIGMENATDLNYAKMVSNHVGTEHHEIIVSKEDMINAIPNVIKDIETYDTTSVRASVGNWLIGKYIKENSDAKVVFNGDGSDELMGGYLYFHKAPNNEAFHNECIRLLNNIYHFDVLRSDKSISSHGLEPRTPFLDKEMTRYYLSIPIKYRNHNNLNQCEKYFIRRAIEIYEPELLPKDVLWRKKEAFSDGVSSLKKSWFEILQESLYSSVNISNNTVNMVPITNEQKYYYELFIKYFGVDCVNIRPMYWMPRFIDATDSSARTLNIYNKPKQDEDNDSSN
tara:strand:- start:44 stop:1723 length:1680 start_codon:yes stop_codon:yes gene_type:complete